MKSGLAQFRQVGPTRQCSGDSGRPGIHARQCLFWNALYYDKIGLSRPNTDLQAHDLYLELLATGRWSGAELRYHADNIRLDRALQFLIGDKLQ